MFKAPAKIETTQTSTLTLHAGMRPVFERQTLFEHRWCCSVRFLTNNTAKLSCSVHTVTESHWTSTLRQVPCLYNQHFRQQTSRDSNQDRKYAQFPLPRASLLSGLHLSSRCCPAAPSKDLRKFHPQSYCNIESCRSSSQKSSETCHVLPVTAPVWREPRRPPQSACKEFPLMLAHTKEGLCLTATGLRASSYVPCSKQGSCLCCKAPAHGKLRHTSQARFFMQTVIEKMRSRTSPLAAILAGCASTCTIAVAMGRQDRIIKFMDSGRNLRACRKSLVCRDFRPCSEI